MMENLKQVVIPNLIRLALIFAGWYISVLNMGSNLFQNEVLFTRWTLLGLFIILIGAYIPKIWNKKQ